MGRILDQLKPVQARKALSSLERLKAELARQQAAAEKPSRYYRDAALRAAQRRIAAVYTPGTLVYLDAPALAEMDAEDRTLEAAYFKADDDGFAQALTEWEVRRRTRLVGAAKRTV